MAEMGSLDYHRSLRGWTGRLVFGSDSGVSALPPAVADLTTTADTLYCIAECPYRDQLRQCGDGCLCKFYLSLYAARETLR